MVRLCSLSLLAVFAGAVLAGSSSEQQVLSDTSVQFSDKWSYTDCGQDLTVTVSGTAVEPIEEGAYADVVVKLGIIKLLTKRFDVCEEARAANTSIQCPVEKGDYIVSHTVALPKEIPQAKFSVGIRGYTSEDDDMLCLDLKVDFMRLPFPKKARLKLGKGKKLPSNVVDTSFKTRSIALPTQSIAIEKDDTVPTNKRRQTFNDILSLLKHYSSGIRKDAIFSARELLQDHPGLLERSIPPLLNACVRLISDEDTSVRKALLSFFGWIFPRLEKVNNLLSLIHNHDVLPQKDLIPHVPLLLLFTASAQTHIFPEIRIDAVRFLDLLLDAVPESVVCGWNESGLGHGKRALEGYLGILSAGTKFDGAGGLSKRIDNILVCLIVSCPRPDPAQATFTASVVLSPQSKLVVLQSLSSFLSHAIDPQSFASSGQGIAPAPTWFLRPSFASTRLYEEYTNIFHGTNGKHLTWNTDPEFESFDEDFAYDPRLPCGEPETAWDLSKLSDLSPEMDEVSRPLGDIPLIVRLSRMLYPTLTATFLDGAPVVFSPSTNPTETEAQMLMAAFKITRTLYSAILQSAGLGSDLLAPCEELKTLLDYLTGYFPFTPAHREAKASVEQAFQDLSVIYCELASLLVLVSGSMDMHRGSRFRAPCYKPSPPLKSHFSFNLQAGVVKSYVIRLLQGDGGSGAQLSRPISAAVYTALLPTIWALLNQRSGHQPEKERSSVLMATLDHAMKTSSGSAVKRVTVEFVGRLLLLEKEASYSGYFNPRDAGEERKFQEWITHLPRTLWEIGPSNVATTQASDFGVALTSAPTWIVGHTARGGSSFMRRVLRTDVPDLQQISSLSSRLTPFFMIVHPILGQVLGPFSKIPSSASHVRSLVLDLCTSLLRDEEGYEPLNGDGLYNAVCEAVKGTSEEVYWKRVTEAMHLEGPEIQR
ncbi:hypothetical protein J3R82DRAFT_852 [Butyriboletus roseoflavus]|nr:hypothetical protein J3R82DRAFT_852 [Butyriboletus roseoflavus]